MENKPTNRGKMSNKRCIRARLQYLYSVGYKTSEPPVVLYFNGFPGWLAGFSLPMFCLNNKIQFSLANANNSASFKRKIVLNHRFCSFTTTNKLVNEAANDSARVSGQDRKKLPTLGTNQIAGFGGFRPLVSLEKNNSHYRSTTCDIPAQKQHIFVTLK